MPGKSSALPCRRNSRSERLYVNTILKLSYYFHALSRFDKPSDQRAKDNLLVLFADEGQEIITRSWNPPLPITGLLESSREAKATIVLATQAYTSIHGSLEKRHADVLMLNLSNELIFTVANQDSAVIASKNIGERGSCRKIMGVGVGASVRINYQRKIKPFFEAYQLRKLPKFRAIIRHLRETVPQATDRSNQSGRNLSPLVHHRPSGIRTLSSGSKRNLNPSRNHE